MAKEGKSKFHLEKGTARNFNLSKGESRKFDLSKDNGDASSNNSREKRWAWLVVALIVLGCLVWWLIPSDKDNKTNPAQSTEDQTVELEQTGEVPAQDVSRDEPIPAEESASAETEQSTAPQAQPAEQKPDTRNQKSTSKVATQSPISSDRDDIEREALNVIRGMYGDGKIRKEKLGSRYQDIQNRVNQLKKEGLF